MIVILDLRYVNKLYILKIESKEYIFLDGKIISIWEVKISELK